MKLTNILSLQGCVKLTNILTLQGCVKLTLTNISKHRVSVILPEGSVFEQQDYNGDSHLVTTEPIIRLDIPCTLVWNHCILVWNHCILVWNHCFLHPFQKLSELILVKTLSLRIIASKTNLCPLSEHLTVKRLRLSISPASTSTSMLEVPGLRDWTWHPLCSVVQFPTRRSC